MERIRITGKIKKEGIQEDCDPHWASQVALVVKNPPANAGRLEFLIPGLGRSPGEGNGYPLQYSCLENSMDRGAWHVTVGGVTNSQT